MPRRVSPGLLWLVPAVVGLAVGLAMAPPARAAEQGFTCESPSKCAAGSYVCDVDCPPEEKCKCTIS